MENRVEIWVVMSNLTELKRTSKTGAPSDIGVIDDPRLRVGSGILDTSSNLLELERYVKFQPQDTILDVNTTGRQVGSGGPLTPYIPPAQPTIPQNLQTSSNIWSLDLFENTTQIPITYQLSDITDISTVRSSYTKTITLPGTKKNLQAFGFIADLNADSTFNPNKRCRAYVIADSITVLDGYIQLLSVVDDQNNDIVKLDCVIYADSANFFGEVGEATIDMLDLQELEHNRDEATIRASWTASSCSVGYYYPLIDYGGWGTAPKLNDGPGDQDFFASGDWGLADIGGNPNVVSQIYPEQLYPAIYAKVVWDKIFQQTGFLYTSNFLNSAYFKNLLIPFNREKLKRSLSWEWNKLFRAGIGRVPGGWSPPGNYGLPLTAFGTQSFATQSTGYWDLIAAANFNISQNTPFYLGRMYGIGNINQASFNSYDNDGVRVRFTDTNGALFTKFHPQDFDRSGVFAPARFTYNPYDGGNYGTFSATANDGWTGRMKFRFGVYYKITEWFNSGPVVGILPPQSGSELSIRRTFGPNGLAYNQYAANPNLNSATNQGDFGTGFVPDINRSSSPILLVPGVTASTNQRIIQSGTFNPIDGSRVYEGVFYSAFLDGATPNCYPSFRYEEFYLEYKRSVSGNIQAGREVSRVEPETAIWIEFFPELGPGETIDMNQVLPLNVKQKDFIMSIIKMFNLTIEGDKNLPNMLKIEPRDDFYSSGVEKDWTYKLDRNSPLDIKILGEVGTKTTIFKYKDDTDYFNADYKTRWEQTYGQFKYIIDNDFAENEKKIEIAFSPTPLAAVPGSQGFIIPKIAKINNNIFQRTNSNIRIVRRTPTGLLPNAFGEVWRFGSTGSVGNLQSTYPYVGHFDDPYDPTDDLNFGQTGDLYYGQDQATNQNLFTKYYWTQMKEYSDKDSRVLMAYFNLTPKDIYDFRFNDKIFIDNQYWKVVKIEEYDPTLRKTSKVTLVKNLNYTAPVPKRVRVNPKPQTGIIGALGSSQNIILTSGVGVVGQGNIVGAASSGSFIIGNGNLLADVNPNTLISGDRNTIGLYASNSNIFGSENILANNTSMTITGDRNVIETQSSGVIFGSSNSIAPNTKVQITGSNNTVFENLINTGDVLTIIGNGNIVATNSTNTFVFGENNIVESSSTQSVKTVVFGSGNTIYPDFGSASTNPVNFLVGKNNTIQPSDNDTVVFGSLNIIGTNSSSYVVGTGNMIAASITQSIVLGSNNQVNSSSVNVIGSDNIVATNSNAAIIGFNNTFDSSVVDSIAIGQNITATENGKVYISDVIFTGGGTGSALSIENTLAVGNDPMGQFFGGTISLVGSVGLNPEVSIEIINPRFQSATASTLCLYRTEDTNGSGYKNYYLDRYVSTFTSGTFSFTVGAIRDTSIFNYAIQVWNYDWSEYLSETGGAFVRSSSIDSTDVIQNWDNFTGSRSSSISLTTSPFGDLIVEVFCSDTSSNTWHILISCDIQTLIVPV